MAFRSNPLYQPRILFLYIPREYHTLNQKEEAWLKPIIVQELKERGYSEENFTGLEEISFREYSSVKYEDMQIWTYDMPHFPHSSVVRIAKYHGIYLRNMSFASSKLIDRKPQYKMVVAGTYIGMFKWIRQLKGLVVLFYRDDYFSNMAARGVIKSEPDYRAWDIDKQTEVSLIYDKDTNRVETKPI